MQYDGTIRVWNPDRHVLGGNVRLSYVTFINPGAQR